MTYTVLVIDDEPTAQQNLCCIIEKHCPDFRVMNCCDNGVQALSLIRTQKPDLVLTDIRIPIMDGLELSRRLHIEYPDIKNIIVSGYQDFEYARASIQYNVIDYVLKPVLPENLKRAFQRALPLLVETTRQTQIRILGSITRGQPVDQEKMKKFFPESSYAAALTRKNGLPSRSIFLSASEIYPDSAQPLILHSRNAMESLTVCPSGLLSENELIIRSRQLHADSAGYLTTVIWQEEFNIEKINDVVKNLYHILNTKLVIGLSQIIRSTRAIGAQTQELNPWSESQINRIRHEPDTEKQKVLLHQLLKRWESEKRPQFWVENGIRKLLGLMHRPDIASAPGHIWNFMLEDAFCFAMNFDDLWINICDLLDNVSAGLSEGSGKVDSATFFQSVRLYVDAHLAEPITIQTVCHIFGISQPYLSRLFRKYTTQSFSQYLTSIRIEKAKEILAQDNDILIKNVAMMVGYVDQYYFSRTFSLHVGASPTEYMDHVNEQRTCL